jgi:pantoate--beta-alanine ligase
VLGPHLAQRWCARARAAGLTLGFVPTMGALHAGHLGLVRRARAECDRVVVSVFVNPLQFDDPRDFARYPRDLAADRVLLDSAGVHLLLTGTLAQFFPGSRGARARIRQRDPGPCARGLEGQHRPGHFAGMATIVARLFEIVQPTRAYFGAKDFQQTLVVRDLSARLGGPVIVVCPTAREPGGLARSSRNQRLSPAQRRQARALYRALRRARSAWRAGERDPRALRAVLLASLERAPLELEYAELRDPRRWTARAPRRALERAVALVAARVGGVRLIDNLRLDE